VRVGVATAIIALGIAIHTALGPERKGSRFEHTTLPGTHDLPTTNNEKDVSHDERSVEGSEELKADVKQTEKVHA